MNFKKKNEFKIKINDLQNKSYIFQIKIMGFQLKQNNLKNI